MKRTRIPKPKAARKHPWHEVLPADPRDPDVVRAKALACGHGQAATSMAMAVLTGIALLCYLLILLILGTSHRAPWDHRPERRRGALITGLGVFGAGSVAGSLAHSVAAVTTVRAVMGAGAAVIMPATVSLVITVEPG